LRHEPNTTKPPQQELPVAGKNKQKLKFGINNNKARDQYSKLGFSIAFCYFSRRMGRSLLIGLPAKCVNK
jgi:hypothetical protein